MAGAQDKPTAVERSEIVRRLVLMGYLGTELAGLVKAEATREEMARALIAKQRE